MGYPIISPAIQAPVYTSGIQSIVDHFSIGLNNQGQIYVNTANIVNPATLSSESNIINIASTEAQSTTSNSAITYSSNTSLSADVYATDVTINSGVTITTNGYNFYCTGTFTNNGTINTGSATGTSYNGGSGGTWDTATGTGGAGGGGGGGGAGGAGSNGGNGDDVSLTYYGGAGGAGGGGLSRTNSYGGPGGNGGNGGSNGGVAGAGGAGGAGGTTAGVFPTITNSFIQSLNSSGFKNTLLGAGGGGGGGGGGGSGEAAKYNGGAGASSAGGYGGYGIYIQANEIIAGTITTTDTTTAGGGGGGGGGPAGGAGGNGGSGAILLAYGAGGYTAGTYTAYQTGVYNYSSAPINVSNTSSIGTAGGINKNYYITILNGASTTSATTSATGLTLTSTTITPSSSSLIVVETSLRVNNNTIGDAVTIQLLNGTNVLDQATYTQEGLASNSNQMNLYYANTFPANTAQTFSLLMFVSGGTGSAKVSKFECFEVY